MTNMIYFVENKMKDPYRKKFTINIGIHLYIHVPYINVGITTDT